MSVCCECLVLSGRGLCNGLITRPEESYRVWCVRVWSWILDNEALAHWGAVAQWKKKKLGYPIRAEGSFKLGWELRNYSSRVPPLRHLSDVNISILSNRLDWKVSRFDSRDGKELFLSSTASGLALGPPQSSFLCTASAFPVKNKNILYVRLLIHLHLVPRLGMRGAVLPLPCTSSWRGA